MSGKMTVVQVKELLSRPVVPGSLIAELEGDDRLAVAQALRQWKKRAAAAQAEASRLDTLLTYERELQRQGYLRVAGVDEAGRGPLAGPVVAAAVILPEGCRISGLDDSKKLSARQRQALLEQILKTAAAVGCAIVDSTTIDEINIYQATKQGMYEALAKLEPAPDAVLIDAVPLTELQVPYQSIIHGDALSASIAAASIVAKVTRDQLMEEYDRQYPEYGFSRHKGYGTREHLEAIAQYGPCPLHRLSFAPLKDREDCLHDH